MRPAFEYIEYRDMLRDAYEDRKSTMSLYSYRMMGERLGVDGSYLFRILQKDLHLPARCMPQAVEFLGLTGRQAEYFQLLAAYQREKRAKAKHEILDKALSLRDVIRAKIEEKELTYFRNWWIVAIRSLLEVVDGRVNPKELAARLQPTVSEKEALEALELLQSLGMVKKGPSGKLILTNAHVTAIGDEKAKAVRAFQVQILKMAQESIERFPKGQRDVSTLTVAIDERASTEIREMMRESRRQIQKCVDEVAKPDRVMQIAMAFFPLAPEVGGKA